MTDDQHTGDDTGDDTGDHVGGGDDGDVGGDIDDRADAAARQWQHRQSQWEEKFQKLVEYKRVHGDTNVPSDRKDPTLTPLKFWIDRQRQSFRKGKLPPDKKARLDDVGFVWESRGGKWEEKFRALQRYKETHGNLLVTRGGAKGKDDRALADWVDRQRRHYRESAPGGGMSASQRARLESIGFVWESRPTRMSQLGCFGASTAGVGAGAPTSGAGAGEGEGGRGRGRGEVGTSQQPAASSVEESSESIEDLLRRVAANLGQDPETVMPHVARLEAQWYFDSRQLRGLPVDTLARFIPHGLARGALASLGGAGGGGGGGGGDGSGNKAYGSV